MDNRFPIKLNTLYTNRQSSKLKPILLSLFAAVSLAVFAVLAYWDFELRSGQKLVLQAGVLSLVLWPVIYWLIFHRISQWVSLRADFFLFSGLITFLFCFLIVPGQASVGRFIATFALVMISSLGIVVSFTTPLTSQTKERNFQMILLLAIAGGTVGMAIYLFNGFSVRMYGDDFCYTVERETRGFFRAVMWFYTHWSGRFFSNFLLMGLGGWRWTTLAQLICILAATFFALVVMVTGSKGWRCTAALAGSFWIPFAVFSVIPDVYKSIYWIVSSVVVLPVMICIPLFVLLVVHLLKSANRKMYWGVPAVFLVSFMIASTHEAAVLGWLTAQSVALGMVWISARKNKQCMILLGVGITAAVAGLALAMLSPGNVLRAEAQGYSRTHSIAELMIQTTGYFFIFLKSITLPGWLMLVTTFGLGWVIETGLPRNGKAAIIVPVIAFIAAASCFLPGVYAMSSVIPTRTQLIPGAYLVYGMLIMGMLLPRSTHKLLEVSVCSVFLLMVPVSGLQNVRRITPTINPMRQFARDWDERDRQARQSQMEIAMISVPWDEWEQGFPCTTLYYQSKFQQLRRDTGD